jgi:hypothetical protein
MCSRTFMPKEAREDVGLHIGEQQSRVYLTGQGEPREGDQGRPRHDARDDAQPFTRFRGPLFAPSRQVMSSETP